MQIWPWWKNEPQAARLTASSTSASSSTISAELPPSSRWARLRCCPASSPTRRPAAVEPVNEMTRTSGCGHHRLADVGAAGQHLQHAGGQAGLLEDAGDRDAAGDRGARVGLEDARRCRARAPGATDRMPRMIGTLNGEMTPTTPTGIRRAIDSRGLFAGQQLAVRAGSAATPPRSTPARRRAARSRPCRRWRRPRGCSTS